MASLRVKEVAESTFFLSRTPLIAVCLYYPAVSQHEEINIRAGKNKEKAMREESC